MHHCSAPMNIFDWTTYCPLKSVEYDVFFHGLVELHLLHERPSSLRICFRLSFEVYNLKWNEARRCHDSHAYTSLHQGSKDFQAWVIARPMATHHTSHKRITLIHVGLNSEWVFTIVIAFYQDSMLWTRSMFWESSSLDEKSGGSYLKSTLYLESGYSGRRSI